MPDGVCKLCKQNSELKVSHIIPSFAFRWLRESSGNGHFRATDNVNRRVQDGIKRYWLCGPCEARLGISETAFATQIFHPYQTESGRLFQYDSWLMHFCTSLSWRVLQFFLDEKELSGWDSERLELINEAERVWREVLLGTRKHPGQFQQHLLAFDRIESATFKLPPNANRYFTRAIDMDFCRGERTIFVFTKLGRFMVLGFIQVADFSHWKGTKVNASQGVIGPRKYVLPREFADYLVEKGLFAELGG